MTTTTTKIFASLEATTMDMTETSQRIDLKYRRDGMTVHLCALKNTHANRRDYGKKTRVYVSGQEDVSFDDLPDGWMYNDDPAIVKECKRRNRQEVKNMRALIAEAAELIPIQSMVEITHSKLGFSRHAGCSMCPCSPGFVKDGAQVRVNIDGIDYPVTDMWISKA